MIVEPIEREGALLRREIQAGQTARDESSD